MKNILLYIVLANFIFLASCGDSSEEKQHTAEDNHEQHDSHDDEHQEDGVVKLSQAQAKTIGLKTAKLTERNLGNALKVTGHLELFPQDKATISPFVGGNVSQIKVIEGDEVRQGQVLAYLKHPDIIDLQQEFQEKHNNMSFLKQDFERKKTLHEQGVSSGKDFQRAQSEYRSAKSSLNGMEAKLKLLNLNPEKVKAGKIYNSIPITCPINGFVDEVHVNIGDYAAPQSPLFSVSDNSKIHVDLKVYEKDIPKVRKGQEIYFEVASKPNEILKATIHTIGKTFEKDPKALHIHAHIDNNDHTLLPGMYVEGSILEGQKKVLSVERAAMVKENEKSYVFVLENPADKEEELRFKQVEVHPEVETEQFIALTPDDNLSKTSEIVITGAYTLLSEKGKAALEHHH